MENYVIYDEIGADDQSVVYKGRRKGTIEFVAVHCVDKRFRPCVTNSVRLLHNLKHSHILQFSEWYETSNHLWVVSEILSGGSLADILVQDGRLPLSIVRDFGADICQGLFHLHQNSVIYARLNPTTVALDSSATSKLIDFRFARLLDEDLDSIFSQVSPKETEPSNFDWRQTFLDQPQYISPEVLDCDNPGGPSTMTMAADLWSLGVLLYRIFVGHAPFGGQSVDDVLAQIYEGTPLNYPHALLKGDPDAAKDLIHLIDGLLKVDLRERFSWKDLTNHPFWRGILAPEIELGLANLGIRDSAGSDETVKNETDSLENTGKTVASEESNDDFDERVEENDDDEDEWQVVRRLSKQQQQQQQQQQHSRPQRDSIDASKSITIAKPIEGHDNLFGLSLSHSSLPGVEKKTSPSPKRNKGVIVEDDSDDSVDEDDEEGDEESKLIFHPSDISISHPYPDQPKVGSVKIDPSCLPVKVLPPSKSPTASDSSLDSTFRNVKSLLSPSRSATSGQSKSATTQKQLAILSYLSSLVHFHRNNGRGSGSGGSNVVSSLIARHSDILSQLTHLMKANVAEDSLRQQSAFVLSAIACVTAHECNSGQKKISPPAGLDLHKILLQLSEVVRDGTTSKLLKSQCFVALYHVFRLWTQWFPSLDQNDNGGSGSGSINVPFPSLSLTVVIRGLRAEASTSSTKEETRAVAACVRIVHVLLSFLHREETVRKRNRSYSSSSKETLSVLKTKLMTPELGQTIWTIVSRSPEMTLRCLAASTLIVIGKADASILHACVDRAGLPVVLTVLTGETNRRPLSGKESKIDSSTSLFTQLTSTILNVLLRHPPHATKISQNKDALKQLMQTCDNTNPIVRAKTIMTLHAMIAANREALIGCCKSRLVGVLEREMKQLGPLWSGRTNDRGKEWKTYESFYLLLALNRFVEFLKILAEEILKDSCEVLRQVCGRKHPSANQSVRLKNSLPHLQPLLQMLSSSSLRPLILEDPLILHHLVGILNETPSIDAKSTNLDPALGSGQTEELVKTILSLFEVLAVSSKIFVPRETETSPTASLAASNVLDEASPFENTAEFDLLIEGVLPPLLSMTTPNSSSTPHVLRLLTHLLSPIMATPAPKLHLFIVERLLPKLADVISAGECSSSSSSSSHSLIPSLGLSLVHILLALSPHPLNASDIPETTKISLASACRNVIDAHMNQKHLLTPTVNQALSTMSTLLASSSHDISAVAQFPLWTQAHHEWKVVSFLVSIVKTAEIDPEELAGDEGVGGVLNQFIDALLGLLLTVVQFVSDRIRFVVYSRKSGKSVNTAAAENLLLHHRPLIRAFSPILHYLMTVTDFDLASTAINCLSQLAQLFGGEHHPPLTRRHLKLYALALTRESSPDVRRSAAGQHVRTILRTLKRLALVAGKDERKSRKMAEVISVFREDEEENGETSLLAVLSQMTIVASSHADVALASMAGEIMEAMKTSSM